MPWLCRQCGANISFSSLGVWIALPAGFILSILVVQMLGLSAKTSLLWPPILVVCLWAAVRVTVLFPFLFPLRAVPSAQKGADSYKRTLRLFIFFWIGIVLALLIEYSIVAWWMYALRAPRSEIDTQVGILSFPLGLVNSEFVISTQKSLAQVLSVLIANSYFYAIALTAVFRIVHGAISRSRVTQLGIGTTTYNDDDDL
jgi:hypothetical protein